MAKEFDIRMLGDREIERAFRRIELKMQRKLIQQAAMKAAEPVLAAAKSRAPVLTGKMRDSLHIAKLKGVRGAAGAVIQTGTRADLGVPSDAEYFYPAVIEYKHAPFMRPAIDENPVRILQIMAAEIRAGLNL